MTQVKHIANMIPNRKLVQSTGKENVEETGKKGGMGLLRETFMKTAFGIIWLEHEHSDWKYMASTKKIVLYTKSSKRF